MSHPDGRILITGATGFIGSHICRRLIAMGAEVHGVSRNPPPSGKDGIHWWSCDLSDPGKTLDVVRKCRPDVILHLASEVIGARAPEFVVPTLHSNLISSIGIMLAACECRCRRVILAGSMEEPGIDENDKVIPSPYAAAKWASTGYARMFHELYGLDVLMLRLFMVYGPGQADLRKLIPYVTLSLLKGESPMLGSGGRPVDWIYVDDVVDAFLAAIEADDIGGRVLDVGSGSLVSIREMVERIASITRPDAILKFGVIPDRPLERVCVADNSKTQEMLNWRQKVSIDDGLLRTVEWYRDHMP